MVSMTSSSMWLSACACVQACTTLCGCCICGYMDYVHACACVHWHTTGDDHYHDEHCQGIMASAVMMSALS